MTAPTSVRAATAAKKAFARPRLSSFMPLIMAELGRGGYP